MTAHGCKKESRRNPSRLFREKKLASQTFSSFPYLSTRVFPALYNINLLPSRLPELELIELARQQVAANKLNACLVLGWNQGLWFDVEGQVTWKTFIPKGGLTVNGRLKTQQDYSSDPDIVIRNQLLNEHSQTSMHKGGYLVGDPENCVRDATNADAPLGDLHDSIIPSGLTQCETCGELKGECFYSESDCYGDKVWVVRCRCENDNQCAACGKPLFNHKLDSCYFNGDTNKILHVAGYLALSHDCNDA